MPQPSAALLAASQTAMTWLKAEAWPFWLRHGIDRAADGQAIGFHEFIAFDDLRCVAEFRRLRVVTRQTYVFAEALAAGFAPAEEALDLGLSYLRRHAFDPDGGYHWRFDLKGGVIDPKRDLYDHAFVLLALATAMQARPEAVLHEEALALDRYLQRVFPHPSGGYGESVPPSLPRRQNPHMHLLEACLAAVAAFGPDPFLDRADGLVDLFLNRMFQRAEGALPEYFDAGLVPHRDHGRFVVEPGHHAEWIWLLHWHEALCRSHGRAVPAGLDAAMRALAQFNDRFGLHPETGALVDVLWSDGQVSSAGQRLWPQTERLKAEMLRRDPDDSRILAAYGVLHAHIAPAPSGLWMEQRLEGGGFAQMAAPASSLYHLTSAYLTAARILRSRLI